MKPIAVVLQEVVAPALKLACTRSLHHCKPQSRSQCTLGQTLEEQQPLAWDLTFLQLIAPSHKLTKLLQFSMVNKQKLLKALKEEMEAKAAKKAALNS